MKTHFNSHRVFKFVALALSLLVFLSASDAPAGGRAATIIDIEAMQPSVLLVQGQLRERPDGVFVRAAGSGTPALWNGRTGAFTAWHVVDDDVDGPFSVSSAGSGVSVRFVRIGQSDVAWADIPRLPPNWRPLEVAPPPLGGRCVAWGHPGGGRIAACSGRVLVIDAKVELMGAKGQWAQIDGVVVFGMSGGPVVDSMGRLFALNSMHTSDTTSMAAIIPAGTPK